MNLAENEYQAEAAGQKCSAHHQEDLSEDFDNVSGFYHKLKHFISEIGEEQQRDQTGSSVVERSLYMAKVEGSIPSPSTKKETK